MHTPLELVATFVPNGAITDPSVATSREAVANPFFAVALFVDISDFTPMTERFEQSGPDGVEQLTAELDRHFGTMIAHITEAGGEIENLLGDALLAYWPAAEADLRATAAAAVDCALKLQGALAGQFLDDATAVNVHAGLVAGPVAGLHLGGHAGHRLYLLCGDPLDRVTKLVDQAGPGELVVDATIRELLGHAIRGTPVSHDGTRVLAFDGQSVKRVAAPRRPPADASDAVHYLQDGLRQRVLAGHQSWIAEIRNITVAFVSITGLRVRSSAELARSQSIVLTMQESVHAHGGAVQCLTMSDKGTVLYVAFGLPLLAHDDDAVRAVAAMYQLRGRLREFDCAASIGVSGGMTYCGLLGTDAWRCYSVRGTVTNRAARLMGVADGEILIDSTVRTAAGLRFTFRPLPPLRLKGIAKPQPAYALEGVLQTTESATSRELFDRDAQLQAIRDAIDDLPRAPAVRALVVEGDAGIGKTALLNAGAELATEAAITVLRGAVQPLSLGAVYAALRGVFESLVNGSGDGSPIERAAQLLSDEERWQRRLPLLAPVLSFPVPDNELTAQMQGEIRSDNTRAVLRHVLDRAAQRSSLFILLDDCQWMDSASWRLITELIRGDTRVLFVLAVRRDREHSEAYVSALLELPAVVKVALDEVGTHAIAELVKQSVDASSVASAVVDFIATRGSGNPFFTQELARSLLEQGRIEVVAGKCGLAGNHDLEAIEFPATLEQVIVSRVDRLQPDVQLTLKVASVIGHAFEFQALLGVHPLRFSADSCRACTNTLEEAQFTQRLQDQAALTYLFRNLILQETVYRLLAFAQRRSLHGTIGSWIEANVANAGASHKVVLAHHWFVAERPDKALGYSFDAGVEALDNGAYAEARRFFQRCLELARAHPDIADDVAKARVLFRLGEVDLRLGRVDDSRESFIAGLAALGLRWPATSVRYAAALLGALARQIYHRVRGVGTDPEQTVRLREQTLANGLEQFSGLFFFEQRLDQLLLADLHGLNFAEQANAPSIIRKLFAQNAVTLSVARAHRWANYYAKAVETYSKAGSTDADLAYQFYYLAMHSIGHGRWQIAHKHLERGIAQAQNIGHRRLELDLLSFRRSALFIQGDYVAGAAANDVYRDAVLSSTDEQHQYFMRIALGEFALRRSDFDDANQLFDEASDLLLRGYALDHLHVQANRAVAKHRLGLADESWQLATAIVALIGTTQPIGYYAMEGYAGIASLFLDHLEDPRSTHSRAELARFARLALRGFDRFSKSFPVSRPRYLMLRARLLEARGRHKRAIRSALEALTAARSLALQFDIAAASEQLGRCRGVPNDARREHAARALAGYVELDLAREATGARALHESLVEDRSRGPGR